MKINVVLITYNHSAYIEEAFQSIVSQKLPDGWEMEIIVADDASIDDTLTILKRLASESYVSTVFLPEEPNLGHPMNYKRAFNACSGEYIAILEGDDYWISQYHLDNHINFLSHHNECVLSMNRPILQSMKTGCIDLGFYDSHEETIYITGRDLAKGNKLGNLSSCVLRNTAVRRLPEGIYELDMDDWLLGLTLSKSGILCKHNKPTSVWRIHSNGQWSGLSTMEKGYRMLQQIDRYDSFLKGIYHDEFIKNQNEIRKQLKHKSSLKSKLKRYLPPVVFLVFSQLLPPAIKSIIKGN